MKQLTQKLKTGEMLIIDIPLPVCGKGMILVRNHYSLISAGTESSTVRTARASLLGKVKERPQQVKQVLDVLKKQGFVQTYRAVMKKLDAYSPLGYSTAGEVIQVGDDVTQYSIGDRVACAGAGYANHTEIAAIPVNLCTKLAKDADYKSSAYNTLGAIALQGIRQADLRLGETCAVIGLGLIGQLTCLMLRASGVRVVGIDIDPYAVEIAGRHSADLAMIRTSNGIGDNISLFSHGLGVDAVIITAGASSLDPVNFAGEICRKRGRIIVVGAVPTGFDRDPYYYRKELELRMSCSYGPGRYDLNYEEKGIDYPAAYVRWTENRNMQAFQDLIYSGKISVDYLTTHEFIFEEASKAYDLIVEKQEPFLGIVLKYDVDKPITNSQIEVREHNPVGRISVGFIGAGSYAQSNLLPNLPKDKSVVCMGVMTNTGTTSLRVAELYGFQFCTSEEKEILENNEINTVFIATRHDSHADYVIKALNSGKNVFVEKPLCLTEGELDQIEEICSSLHFNTTSAPHLLVGFNRRFSPLIKYLKKKVGSGPMSMLYRINSGTIPSDSWIQDIAVGGGRIIGEACHFVDLLTFLCGSLPKRVYASALPDPEHLNDIVNISLEFENGSIGTISYFSNGSKMLEKEYIEIHQSGVSAILKDFKELVIYGNGKTERKKLLNQDKGQAVMVQDFIEVLTKGRQPLIPIHELLTVSRTTFKAHESLRTHLSFNFPN